MSPRADAPSDKAPERSRLWASRSERLSIRFRLGAALAIALSPVLALGVLQAVLSFNHDTSIRQGQLNLAAQRSAASARARMQAASVLLESLNPGSVGLECAPRLAELLDHTEGYENFIRFNKDGRVQCAAASTGDGLAARDSPWFGQLKAGDPVALAVLPAGQYATSSVLLAGMRAAGPDGAFGGALVAILSLNSLKPDLSDPTLPQKTEVALYDDQGHVIAATSINAFAAPPKTWLKDALSPAGLLYTGKDAQNRNRIHAVSSLLGDQIFVALSAPAPGILSWARLNALSGIFLPLLAWLSAWAAVWMVADRVVIRWLTYLDRIAAIYARGRFSVRPVQADTAPREIRALAHTLDSMADAIVARDLSLRDSLSQKDAMMREIHHRVKNNLQVITSLLNMQQRALTDPAAREAMGDTRQRITALALIYRALYQSPDLRRVDVRQFLEELVAQLGSGEGGRPSTIRTELQADDLEIDPDKLAPLALFAVEAITNARKHAFGEAGGVIHVRFAVSPEEVIFEVSDNGQGVAQEPAAAGVGKTLMSAFARQLRGQTETSSEGGGTSVRLIFPTPEPPSNDERGPFQLTSATTGSRRG